MTAFTLWLNYQLYQNVSYVRLPHISVLAPYVTPSYVWGYAFPLDHQIDQKMTRLFIYFLPTINESYFISVFVIYSIRTLLIFSFPHKYIIYVKSLNETHFRFLYSKEVALCFAHNFLYLIFFGTVRFQSQGPTLIEFHINFMIVLGI